MTDDLTATVTRLREAHAADALEAARLAAVKAAKAKDEARAKNRARIAADAQARRAKYAAFVVMKARLATELKAKRAAREKLRAERRTATRNRLAAIAKRDAARAASGVE